MSRPQMKHLPMKYMQRHLAFEGDKQHIFNNRKTGYDC